MSTLLKSDNLETKQAIVEDGIYHARLSTKKVTTSNGNKLIISHEIIEPVNDRKTGEPIKTTVKIDRWVDLEEKDGEEIVAEKDQFGMQILAQVIGHKQEDGDFETEDLEDEVVKVKVEYAPSGVSKAGKEYPASNRIKSVLAKDETFEEVPY